MESTVHISRHALDYFRSKARDTPLEIHAYLIGEVHYPNKYIVTSVEHAREYDIQTEGAVAPSGDEWLRVNRKADEQGRRIIGDIHSHPNEDAVMSPPDYEACVTDGMHLCGIVSVRGRKTKVRFWHVNSALPCEVSYDEVADLEEESV
jgi:proteasome lid subunit RPN8/RPN11